MYMYYESKVKKGVSTILKMLIFHSFKALGSTFSRLHQRLLKSFEEIAIYLRHLEKSVLEGNLCLGPLEIILRTQASGMTFRLPVITYPAGDMKIRIRSQEFWNLYLYQLQFY